MRTMVTGAAIMMHAALNSNRDTWDNSDWTQDLGAVLGLVGILIIPFSIALWVDWWAGGRKGAKE
jgi:hypothetical protein